MSEEAFQFLTMCLLCLLIIQIHSSDGLTLWIFILSDLFLH
jgi:hypothetical protein